MTTVGSYNFNNLGSIKHDSTDQSQSNVYNTRFANYTLSNYFSEDISDTHVKFATEQPAVMFNGTFLGRGLGGNVIDIDSELLLNQEQNQRAFEKLSLNSRPYATVPYLGRGSCDPNLESQLLQGELTGDKKSVSTIMDKPFTDYTQLILDEHMNERVSNADYTVEENSGWVRGGSATRDMSADEFYKKNNRPGASAF
jgi:hypothetical protein